MSNTVAVPAVTIEGVSATVTFSGLAPGYMGLYQVNVQVPGKAPVVLKIGGVTGNAIAIAVQ